MISMVGLDDTCRGCGKPLLMRNLFMDDGCPCNTKRGINLVPRPCRICGAEDCVKPGHRLVELFGAAAIGTAAPAQAIVESIARCGQDDLTPHAWMSPDGRIQWCASCGAFQTAPGRTPLITEAIADAREALT